VTDLVKKSIGVVLVLALGVGAWVLYSSMEPTVSRLQDTDPLAGEALELVKKHLSREGYTLEQELQLSAQKDDKYVVRKIVREKGSVEWIEREFAWRVDMKEKSIRVISLAAQQFMPFENLPPLPHGDQISLLPKSLETVGQFG
jgi:hypothetical protein